MNWARAIRIVGFLVIVVLAALVVLGWVRDGFFLGARYGLPETEYDRSLRAQGNTLFFLAIALQPLAAALIVPLFKARLRRNEDNYAIAEAWFFALMSSAAGTIVTVFLLIQVLSRRV
jgi:hypothetical protein